MDSILFWNEVALEANRVSFTNGKMEQPGPTLSSRALAIVHLAMYDVYAAIYPNAGAAYLPNLPTAPQGASVKAAVAAAAHTTLAALYPSQKTFFDFKLTLAGDVFDPGHAFGVDVAIALLKDRKDDPGVGSDGYMPSADRNQHKADPDNPQQGFHAPFYGARSKGFAISQRWGLSQPPRGTDVEYLNALREVRGKGIAPDQMGTLPASIVKRTEEQTVIGVYWGYDGSSGIGTPPRFYNQILRKIAQEKNNDEATNARLFALVNVALADAGILAWDEKYIHNFWRPVIGIREHDQSMGDNSTPSNSIDSDCDIIWLPFGAPATNALNQSIVSQQPTETYRKNQAVMGKVKNFTPPFPAYPSGHATFGAAAFHMIRLFYNITVGDRQPDHLCDNLSFISDELNGISEDSGGTIRPKHSRKFPGGLWQMIEENGRSRVFLGVHWVFDAFLTSEDGKMDLSKSIGGVPLGIKVAEDIFLNKMKKASDTQMEKLPIVVV